MQIGSWNITSTSNIFIHWQIFNISNLNSKFSTEKNRVTWHIYILYKISFLIYFFLFFSFRDYINYYEKASYYPANFESTFLDLYGSLFARFNRDNGHCSVKVFEHSLRQFYYLSHSLIIRKRKNNENYRSTKKFYTHTYFIFIIHFYYVYIFIFIIYFYYIYIFIFIIYIFIIYIYVCVTCLCNMIKY